MKKFIIESNGVNLEGIFRLAGEQTEIQRLKSLMNKKQLFETKDINAIASLIKVFFFCRNFFELLYKDLVS